MSIMQDPKEVAVEKDDEVRLGWVCQGDGEIAPRSSSHQLSCCTVIDKSIHVAWNGKYSWVVVLVVLIITTDDRCSQQDDSIWVWCRFIR